MLIKNITIATIFTIFLVVKASKPEDEFEKQRISRLIEESIMLVQPSESTKPDSTSVVTVAFSPEVQEFEEAIKSGNFHRLEETFGKIDDASQKEYIRPLLQKGSAKIIEMIKGTDSYRKLWILRRVLISAEQGLIDEVFKEVKLNGSLLGWVADSANLVCETSKFVSFLERIPGENLKDVVERGVYALFLDNKPDCFDSLLSELATKMPSSSTLIDAATSKAFDSAILFRRWEHVKRYAVRSAVSAKDYIYGLCETYYKNRDLFYWLLGEADIDDLRLFALGYERRPPPEAAGAVNKAIKREESHSGARNQRSARRRKARNDAIDSATSLPTALITNIIGEYDTSDQLY
jgi:hypothetical protein